MSEKVQRAQMLLKADADPRDAAAGPVRRYSDSSSADGAIPVGGESMGKFFKGWRRKAGCVTLVTRLFPVSK